MNSNDTTELVEQAKAFAISAHQSMGQRRRYTGEPYWHHLREVVELVASVEHDEAMLAAAWLHDVVEDTWATLDLIEDRFGADVASLVDWLTKSTTSTDGSRAERARRDRERLAQAPARAQTIKLADIISNCSTIAERDPEFARVYLAEKRLAVAAMRSGNAHLQKFAELALGF